MNTQELLNMDKLVVPWYDNIDSLEDEDVEPSENIDEFALEIEEAIAKGEETLNSCSFTEGRRIRATPGFNTALVIAETKANQKQKQKPWQ